MTKMNYFGKIAEEIKRNYGVAFSITVENEEIYLRSDFDNCWGVEITAKEKFEINLSHLRLAESREALKAVWEKFPAERVFVEVTDGDTLYTVELTKEGDDDYLRRNTFKDLCEEHGVILRPLTITVLGKSLQQEDSEDGSECREISETLIIYARYEDTRHRFYEMNDDDIRRECRPEKFFQDKTYPHGLAAYAGTQNTAQIIKNLNEFAFVTGEICCSWMGQEIGPCGVYVRGNVTVASTIDLCSWRDEHGRRRFDPEDKRARDGIVTRKEEFTTKKWDHCEFLVENPVITGVWLKDWAEKKDPKLARMLRKWCANNYVPLTIVGARH